MIDKWILNNFKSIDREKGLEFRPLTVFTGANSSGKSTILQSILLVTQTMQSPIASKSVVLNGMLKKFGSYDDIVNRRDFNKNVHIGFCLTDNMQHSREDYIFRHINRGLKRAECSFEISSDGKEENLSPVLQCMNLATYSDNEKRTVLECSKRTGYSEEENKAISTCGTNYQPSDFSYVVNADLKQEPYYFSNVIDGKWKPVGTNLFHFLPSSLIVYTTYKERLQNSLTNYLLSLSHSYYELEKEDEKIVNPLIEEKAMNIVEDIYSNKKYRDGNKFVKSYNFIKNNFTIRRLHTVLGCSILDGEEKKKYVKSLMDLLESVPEEYLMERMPMFYHSGINFIRDFFSEHIKYLGPLREEPKSLYPLENNGSATNLGLKGENTAAVFENNKKRKIKYIEPSYYEDFGNGIFKITEGTLDSAINKWLIYLGVAKAITTNDKGKFGHELKISTADGIQQDMTHVGVGVSQILPILVLCFLADAGDTIILEQPELHLHPKVQTRLADFFVSMNILGKQCIIETHSEYMINRLRYLVAESSDGNISNSTMIYFVEKDSEMGYSKYRPITINKYGVIEDWPKDFFDESERIASEILRAGMKKRMQEETYYEE